MIDFPLPMSEMPNLPMYLYPIRNEFDKNHLKDILFFHRFGFLKIDLDIDQLFIDEFESQLQKSIITGDVNLESPYYSYGYKNTVYDYFKTNSLSEELLYNTTILNTIEYLFAKKPKPFHTMNTFLGETKAIHNQLLHLNTTSTNHICKVFIALEDTDLSNGTVKFSPKSHLLNKYTFEDFAIPYMEDSIERMRLYNKYIMDISRFNSLMVKPFKTNRISALIMSPSLYHGERRLVDKDSSRFSQYNVYTFDGIEEFWQPVKSDIMNCNIKKINLEM